MRLQASLCGLELAIAAEGEREACARFAEALAPHARGARGPVRSGAGSALDLQLRLLPGLPTAFERLAVSRSGATFQVSGDCVEGQVGPAQGSLDVFGGSAAALQIAMRLVCALWLAPRSGLLLHGASVELGGRAIALLGPSGAGKTTVSRRLGAAGAHVIADEVAAVRLEPQGAGARLFGHPLPRRFGDGDAPEAGLPLAAIGMLAHAPEGAPPSVSRLSQAQAARTLLSRVFLPAADAALIERALACADALCAAVPIFSLSLPNDARAADAALSLFEVRP